MPGTAGEAPFLFDADGSQLATGGWRFADGYNYFTYKFTPPAGADVADPHRRDRDYRHLGPQFEIVRGDTFSSCCEARTPPSFLSPYYPA